MSIDVNVDIQKAISDKRRMNKSVDIIPTKKEKLILVNIQYNEAGDCIIAENEAPCVVCGKPTKLIEYCFECRLCSEQCQHRFVEMCFPQGDINSDLK